MQWHQMKFSESILFSFSRKKKPTEWYWLVHVSHAWLWWNLPSCVFLASFGKVFCVPLVLRPKPIRIWNINENFSKSSLCASSRYTVNRVKHIRVQPQNQWFALILFCRAFFPSSTFFLIHTWHVPRVPKIKNHYYCYYDTATRQLYFLQAPQFTILLAPSVNLMDFFLSSSSFGGFFHFTPFCRNSYGVFIVRACVRIVDRAVDWGWGGWMREAGKSQNTQNSNFTHYR